jgi:hypothetical protein
MSNLAIVVPENIVRFAESKGENFNKLFLHFISNIDADEIAEIRTSGRGLLDQLLKIRPALGTTLALNPKKNAGFIFEEIETLSFEEIAGILEAEINDKPKWSAKLIGSFLETIVSNLTFKLIDDMFEIDSRSLAKSDQDLFNRIFFLTHLVGLSIPESLEQGNRFKTWYDNLDQKQ